MQDGTTLDLNRDCIGIRIPDGANTTLTKGTQVYIMQTLGGTYTVRTLDGMFRIAGKDADALGMASLEELEAKEKAKAEVILDEKLIWETLKGCYDPEIPVNIVDLGLVYDLHIEPTPSGKHKVEVKMTLTAPGCGMGPVIARDAQEKILELPGVEESNVEVVWDPPWHQSMITAEGRKILGLE